MTKILKLIFTALLLPLALPAQNITGQVKDALSGEGLIGATVIVKSAKGQGTTTDTDGNFSLPVTDRKSVV